MDKQEIRQVTRMKQERAFEVFGQFAYLELFSEHLSLRQGSPDCLPFPVVKPQDRRWDHQSDHWLDHWDDHRMDNRDDHRRDHRGVTGDSLDSEDPP